MKLILYAGTDSSFLLGLCSYLKEQDSCRCRSWFRTGCGKWCVLLKLQGSHVSRSLPCVTEICKRQLGVKYVCMLLNLCVSVYTYKNDQSENYSLFYLVLFFFPSFLFFFPAFFPSPAHSLSLQSIYVKIACIFAAPHERAVVAYAQL